MRFAAVRPRLNGRADGELRSCLQGCAFAGCALPLPRAALFSPRLQGGGARHSPCTKPAALSPAPAGADFFAPYRVAVVTYFPLRLQRRLQLLRSAILRRLLSPRLRRRLQRRPASGGADPFLLFHPARNGSPAQAFLAARFRGLLPGRATEVDAGKAVVSTRAAAPGLLVERRHLSWFPPAARGGAQIRIAAGWPLLVAAGPLRGGRQRSFSLRACASRSCRA